MKFNPECQIEVFCYQRIKKKANYKGQKIKFIEIKKFKHV